MNQHRNRSKSIFIEDPVRVWISFDDHAQENLSGTAQVEARPRVDGIQALRVLLMVEPDDAAAQILGSYSMDEDELAFALRLDGPFERPMPIKFDQPGWFPVKVFVTVSMPDGTFTASARLKTPVRFHGGRAAGPHSVTNHVTTNIIVSDQGVVLRPTIGPAERERDGSEMKGTWVSNRRPLPSQRVEFVPGAWMSHDDRVSGLMTDVFVGDSPFADTGKIAEGIHLAKADGRVWLEEGMHDGDFKIDKPVIITGLGPNPSQTQIVVRKPVMVSVSEARLEKLVVRNMQPRGEPALEFGGPDVQLRLTDCLFAHRNEMEQEKMEVIQPTEKPLLSRPWFRGVVLLILASICGGLALAALRGPSTVSAVPEPPHETIKYVKDTQRIVDVYAPQNGDVVLWDSRPKSQGGKGRLSPFFRKTFRYEDTTVSPILSESLVHGLRFQWGVGAYPLPGHLELYLRTTPEPQPEGGKSLEDVSPASDPAWIKMPAP